MRRIRWELLAGLSVGLGLGLAYAWGLAPAPLAGSAPSQLRADFKDAYRGAVASAYVATGDLQRARARLDLLKEADPEQALVAQAQRALSAGLPFDHAQELARLASDLQAGISSVIPAQTASLPTARASPLPSPAATLDLTSTAAVLTASPRAPRPSPALPSADLTATKTQAPPPSPSAAFKRVGTREVCDPSLPPGLLQVIVLGRTGDPLPGIEITITWSGGEERFFTGLQPEIGMGYADFVMSLDNSYALQVARIGTPVTGIRAPSCSGTGGITYVGGLELTFQEP